MVSGLCLRTPRSGHPAGGAMGTVRVGQHLVSARAPVAPGVLEPLLRKLVEVAPG